MINPLDFPVPTCVLLISKGRSRGDPPMARCQRRCGDQRPWRRGSCDTMRWVMGLTLWLCQHSYGKSMWKITMENVIYVFQISTYPLIMTYIAIERSTMLFIGKLTMSNGQCSIAMLNLPDGTFKRPWVKSCKKYGSI